MSGSRFCESCLIKQFKNKTKEKTYINEVFSWDHTVYDLLSLAYYYNKDYENSLININKAIELCNEDRLKKNKNIIKKELKN